MVVTIKDVALAAGVSKTTACDALRGNRKVAESTRARVVETAARLGYVPSGALSAIATHRFKENRGFFKVLCLLVEEPTSHDSYGANLRHMLGRSEKPFMGVHYNFATVSNLAQVQRQLDRAYREGIEGIVLGAFPFEYLTCDAVASWLARFTVVSVGAVATNVEMPYPTIHPDYFGDVTTAFKRARESGCRRIGFVLFRHTVELNDDRIRRAAALDCLNSIPASERIPVLEQQAHAADNDTALLEWERRHRPECVISMLPRNYGVLRTAGRAIPDDLRFISLRIDESYPEYGIIAGLNREFDANRYAITSTLRESMSLRERGIPSLSRHILIKSRWVAGSTFPEQAA